MEEKYFEVVCKCGHVGRKHFIRVSFPIIAQSKKDASSIARYIPRVKHDHKDAILDCIEICKDDFNKLQELNNSDPYLKCKNHQEQENITNFSSRIEDEHICFFHKGNKPIKSRNISYKIKKQKEVNDVLKYEVTQYINKGVDYELLAY